MSGRGTAPSLRLGAAALLAGTALISGAGIVSAHDRGDAGGAGSAGAAASGSSSGSAPGRSNHTGPGDANSGDVWLDTAGQPAGPGHEMDPHLPCADIVIYGAGLADSNGTYTVDGWSPSGSQEQDYASTWAYNVPTGGTQQVSVISISQLISTAVANGDTPQSRNGFHFKLNLLQDPQKHKTFWVSCPGAGATAGAAAATGATRSSSSAAIAVTSAGTAAAATTSTGSAAPSALAPQNRSSGAIAAIGSAAPSAAAPAAAPAGGVLGISTSVPQTGAGIAAGLAVLLLTGGGAMVAISRRRGAASS